MIDHGDSLRDCVTRFRDTVEPTISTDALCEDGVAIHPSEASAVDEVGARKGLRDAMILKQDRAIGDAREGVEVVRRDEHRLAGIGASANPTSERVGDDGVKPRKRFVVERDGRWRDPSGGDGNT